MGFHPDHVKNWLRIAHFQQWEIWSFSGQLIKHWSTTNQVFSVFILQQIGLMSYEIKQKNTWNAQQVILHLWEEEQSTFISTGKKIVKNLGGWDGGEQNQSDCGAGN